MSRPDGLKEYAKVEIPHKCPVCNGNGKVPAGFYQQVVGTLRAYTLLNASPEPCKTCNGTGMVWKDAYKLA